MRTTPVGVYPNGATPDGIHDMAGNVWEWTATRYAEYPYDPDAKLEDPDATGLRIVPRRRMDGQPQDGAVRLSRLGAIPGYWNNTCGFRLARTSL